MLFMKEMLIEILIIFIIYFN